LSAKTIKKIVFASIVVIILLIIGFSSFYIVNEGEEALVLTFGKFTDQKGPGLYMKIPFIQSIEKESVTQIRTMEYGFRTKTTGNTTASPEYEDLANETKMLTGDGNIVEVEVIYSVVISNVYDYFYKVDDPWGTLQEAFATVLRRNIQNKTIDDALLNKQQIEAEILPDFRDLVKKYEIGITVREVRIQNISVPNEVEAAYQDVNNAKNEKTKKLEEAEKYSNEVVPAARANAYKMIQTAEAYKAEKIAQAQGDVANFLAVLNKYSVNKGITKLRLYIETFEQIMSKVKNKYIIEADDGLIKFLPIQNEQQGGTQNNG
jgi:membrane protease subunit HflK